MSAGLGYSSLAPLAPLSFGNRELFIQIPLQCVLEMFRFPHPHPLSEAQELELYKSPSLLP